MGSFLNVCIHRLPRGESLIRPSSHCPVCGTPIRWYHNIPLVSYVTLKGRCRNCGAPISLRYPLVELCGALAGLGAFWMYGFSLSALWLFCFTCLLLVGIVTDIREQILPDEVTLGGTILGLLFAAGEIRVLFLSSLWGACAGSLLFLLILLGYYLFRGHHGMGFGDVKLMACIGAFLGFPGVITIILYASILGLVWGVVMILCYGKSMKYALPFGAFLGFSALAYAWAAAPLKLDLLHDLPF